MRQDGPVGFATATQGHRCGWLNITVQASTQAGGVPGAEAVAGEKRPGAVGGGPAGADGVSGGQAGGGSAGGGVASTDDDDSWCCR